MAHVASKFYRYLGIPDIHFLHIQIFFLNNVLGKNDSFFGQIVYEKKCVIKHGDIKNEKMTTEHTCKLVLRVYIIIWYRYQVYHSLFAICASKKFLI